MYRHHRLLFSLSPVTAAAAVVDTLNSHYCKRADILRAQRMLLPPLAAIRPPIGMLARMAGASITTTTTTTTTAAVVLHGTGVN